MITYQEARKIVDSEIEKMNASNLTKVALFEDKIMETTFLWMFFYQSDEYIKTRNINSLVGGNAPFMISKLDGGIFQYRTGYTEDQMIELFEEENNCYQLSLVDESHKDVKKTSFMQGILGWSLQELNERRQQNNWLIDSGNRQKLETIQKSLQKNNINTEIKVNEVFSGIF